MIAILTLAVIIRRSVHVTWTQEIAGYHLVKWSDEIREVQTLVLKDPKGRIVTAIQDNRVTPFFDDEFKEDSVVRPQLLTGNGIPDVVFRGWSGGAHASFVYYVWELGPRPHCLVAYSKGNVDDEKVAFKVVHLEPGRARQIKSWYDGYGYLATEPLDSGIPIVLKYERGRFVDRTTRCRTILRQAAQSAWDNLFETDLANANAKPRDESSECAVKVIALADMMGTRTGAWTSLKKALNRPLYSWLKVREPLILKIIRGRKCRYFYPRAYDPNPAQIPTCPDWGEIKGFGF